MPLLRPLHATDLQRIADAVCRRAHARRVTVRVSRPTSYLGCAYHDYRALVTINVKHPQHRDRRTLLDTLAHEIAHCVLEHGRHNGPHARLTARLLGIAMQAA